MTRQEYINAVKVKLDEISPYSEPSSYVIANGEQAYDNVKPIISYIDKTLDEATRNCLRSLPLSLLHADIQGVAVNMAIDADGVGTISSLSKQLRLVRYTHPALKRTITAFITTEDPLYLLQQSRINGVRGGTAKPVAVWSSALDNNGDLEIYSFPKSMYNTANDTDGKLYSIDLTKRVGVAADYTGQPALVASPIEELVVLECAAMVSDILGNTAAAQMCRQEWQSKIQTTLN